MIEIYMCLEKDYWTLCLWNDFSIIHSQYSYKMCFYYRVIKLVSALSKLE